MFTENTVSNCDDSFGDCRPGTI